MRIEESAICAGFLGGRGAAELARGGFLSGKVRSILKGKVGGGYG